MDLVVDNSVCMAWAFEDEADAYCDAALGALASGRALVPALWPLEVANALTVAEKRRRMKPADSLAFVAQLRRLPFAIQPAPTMADLESLYSLACARGLSAYDAAYLQLAIRSGAPLATRDAALLRAARDAGVRIWSPPA
jgi:predicted nucleic acid-binding protein